MKWRRFALAVVVSIALGQWSVGDELRDPSRPELDPELVLKSAIERLKSLEAKHAALKGVADIKPRLEVDDNQRFKTAYYTFEQNAVPPGKNPARAKDETKPFVYVSITIWSGASQQPPAGLRPFKWKGQDYAAWVQVYGSDGELVKTVRKAVDEMALAPTADK